MLVSVVSQLRNGLASPLHPECWLPWRAALEDGDVLAPDLALDPHLIPVRRRDLFKASDPVHLITGGASNDVDVDEAIQPDEVIAVAGVQRQLIGQGSRGDQEIHHSGATGFATGRHNGGNDSAVAASGIAVEGQRIEGRLSTLETILTSSLHIGIRGRMWASGQLSHGDGAHGDLERQLGGIHVVEIDDHGRVEHPAPRARRVSHEA